MQPFLLFYVLCLQLKEIRRKLYETEQGQDDQELTYNETIGDLKSLIIYAKSTSIKPWVWRKQKATTVTQMFSFGEPAAVELCAKWPRGEPYSLMHSLFTLTHAWGKSQVKSFGSCMTIIYYDVMFVVDDVYF